MKHGGATAAITVASLLLLAPCPAVTHAASAVFGGIDVVGSEKGCALTLSADAPFSMSVAPKGPGKNDLAAVVSVRCVGAIYGLDEFSFNEFPAPCPIRRMTVSESPAANSFELLVGMTIAPDKKILAKQKGNRWIILLSHEPFAAFSWSATPAVPRPAAAAAMPPAQAAQGAIDNGQSRLTDITLLARDRVERLTFLFDRPTVMRLKREEDRVVVLFVNTTSTLPVQRLTLPSAQLSSIDLKQVAHGGTMWLGASVFMKKTSASGALLQAYSDRLVVYCASDTLERLSAWSAKQGTVMSYPFVNTQRFAADYLRMEEKAKTDLNAPAGGGSPTFAVRDAGRQPKKTEPLAMERETPQTAAPAPSEPAAVRLIVTKNNVNLRAGPSSADSILCRLSLGATASLDAKKEGWVRISTKESSGWVTSAMVVDSARAPKALLDKAAELRARRLQAADAAEKAAELAARKKKLLEEQTAQNGQKRKLVEEQKAKKQAEIEAKEKLAAEQKARKQSQQELLTKAAAARDSVLRYNASLQDSLEKAKREAGPKLVEYHVFGRDPFMPLSSNPDSAVPNVEDMNLVGILYDQTDRIGLVENRNNKARSFALRENDPVPGGYVLRIQPDKMLFLINEMGISRTYALKLSKEKQK
jgi:hypothetical protein